MKKIYMILAAMLLTMTASAAVVQTKVMLKLNGTDFAAEAILNDDGHTATIGCGYSACIPHYAKGYLTIPSKVTYNGTEYAVTAVADVAFRFCNQLKEVVVGEGVQTIGNFAFVGCSGLESVSLPSTVTALGSGAFAGLGNLKSVRVAATTPPAWRWYDVFQADGSENGAHAELKLYVPENSKTAYQTAKQTYKWDSMDITTTPYTWKTDNEQRTEVGWGSYFKADRIASLEEARFADIITVDGVKYLPEGDHAAVIAYQGEGGQVKVAGSITATVGGQQRELPVTRIEPGAFSNIPGLNSIDLRACASLERQSVKRVSAPGANATPNPFADVPKEVLIYLPAGQGHEATDNEPNVVIGDECRLLLLSEKYDFRPLLPFKAAKAVYDNVFAAGTSGKRMAHTICLPFSIDLQSLLNYPQQDAMVYELSYIGNGGEFMIEVCPQQMEAGKPYLIIVNNGSFKLEAADVQVAVEPQTKEIGNSNNTEKMGQWCGNFTTLYQQDLVAQKAMLLTDNGTWVRIPDVAGYATQLLPFHVFFAPTDSFTATNGKTVFNAAGDEEIIFNGDIDDPTAIQTPYYHLSDDKNGDRYFDLSGRELQGKPEKGVYIYKGKKILR